MSAVGIIAEFNPLHTGHKYIIDCAHKLGDTVVCVISGNFVQRGDVAVISKNRRVEFALRCGADIVAEMPVLWSMSTAQNFALAGVWQLYNLGCNKIIFGSECGDIEKLKHAADVLCGDNFFSLATQKAKSGITFAAAREYTACELGIDFNILRNPNDNLGIEYIIAAKKLNLPIEFYCTKRLGAAHDSNDLSDEHVSSSYIRKELQNGNFDGIKRFIPTEIQYLTANENTADIYRLETAMLCSLRNKTADQLKNLPDISEGLHNKIYNAAKTATTLDGLYAEIKSKRYTLARIRRLVLSAFLDFDNSLFMTPPPYVRVLGFNKSGLLHLKKTHGLIPVVTRASQIKQLGLEAQKVFDTECRVTDIYSLSLKKPLECGLELKQKLIKTEELL